ncbi:oligosaccharyltransferase complex subunit epsilon [Malassezia vespertilionis]|nr:oligosaccharyltransferase complex subunit epsilon [Malassezia vespertilionis]WFD07429.1 oligosaccharyltransferase complex subunit epsilon [Malassezia vespertilionis]
MPPKVAKAPQRSAGAKAALTRLIRSYGPETPARLKLIDAFLLFLFVTGVAQFVYCVLLSDYPFNAFVAGFAATVGQFVLAMSLRIQTDPKQRSSAGDKTPERAFAEFLFASVVLHYFVVSFLG